MATSPVMVEVDLWGSGRLAGHLRVPQSRDDSGWGTIQVPIVVIANGTGPTVLLTAGNHGDEYEGQVALLDLARTLPAEEVQGRVILLPAMHYPACAAGKRLSPLDGRDFNRCFPGDPFGGFALSLAHFVDSVLLPLCDVQMDLHSGGTGMDIVPSAVGHMLDHPEMQARTLAMADAFGAPVTLLLKEVNAGPTLLAAAENRGVVALSSELGGGGRLNPRALAITKRGVRNVLRHAGVLQGKPEIGEYGHPRRMTVPDLGHYVFAPADGIWEAAHELGAAVQADAPAGLLHRIEDPTAPPIALSYKATGLLWCVRHAGRVKAGDPVAVIARDL
ncbi:succinylglutamate desuccinylase/aspartoacylase family protein [Falsiroseomonas oryzae]|uniref:succinylglutamate desuccinylase/aspartoacylase family protein n=1 Tax=Falsiroseomonas oryzae TaxID=2766473 RepID=UPI0022EB77D1|nr:succinylglutamate desuccinylase/aspartoacylase family protein [Roseomonas sp. MO-31]